MEDLPEGATAAIRENVQAWRFESAVRGIDEIDSDITRYNDLSAKIIDMASEASALGLSFPTTIADSLDRWEFEDTTLAIDGAQDAMGAYRAARAAVFSDRDLWERLGLIGGGPEGQLDDAGDSFLSLGVCEDPSGSGKCIQWAREVWEAMRPFTTEDVYVNYLGQETDEGVDRVKAAYGPEKYQRLVALKNKYDPANLFRLNQNIKPS